MGYDGIFPLNFSWQSGRFSEILKRIGNDLEIDQANFSNEQSD